MEIKCKGIFGLRTELDKHLKAGKTVRVINSDNSWYTIEVNHKEKQKVDQNEKRVCVN